MNNTQDEHRKKQLKNAIDLQDQTLFNTYMDQHYNGRHLFGGMYTPIQDLHAVKLNKKQTVSFIHLLEGWLVEQNKDIQEDVVCTQSHDIHIKFFKHSLNPALILNNIDVACLFYNQDREESCERLEDICEHAPQCIDLIMEHTSAQEILQTSPHDIEGFFLQLLTANNIKHAVHFFDQMQHRLAPKWVSVFINAAFRKQNVAVIEHMSSTETFQQWVHEKHLDLFLMNKNPFYVQDLSDMQSFQQPLGRIWNVICNCIARHSFLSNKQNTGAWVTYVQQQPDRISFVRDTLEYYFKNSEYYYQQNGTRTISSDKQHIIDDLLDCLTHSDCDEWLNNDWPFNHYFNVFQHPLMVNAILTKNTPQATSSNMARKM